MYSYSLTQWILFFFWYCFLGWIWESFFVSAKKLWKTGKWEFINRGFLHGPLIPIYGFAAVVILQGTLPVRENTYAVYVMGALTATLFELVTGTAMERLFKVKYWDYSELPLNYEGHICLFVSLFWGMFAVLLVRMVHVKAEVFFLKLSDFTSEIAAFTLTIAFTYDFAVSFNEAMDLREILESLTENNETLQRLERRFNAVVAFTALPDKVELKGIRLSAREKIVYRVENLRGRNEVRLNRIKEYIQLPEYEKLADLRDILEKIEKNRRSLTEKSNKQYLRAVRQLKRNPYVSSKKHQETLELLKDLLKNRD